MKLEIALKIRSYDQKPIIPKGLGLNENSVSPETLIFCSMCGTYRYKTALSAKPELAASMPYDSRDNIEPSKNTKEKAYYVIEDVVCYIPSGV